MTDKAHEIDKLVQELLAFHDCADGDVASGNGHFRLQCLSDSDQQRMNLRAVLRAAADALTRSSERRDEPRPISTGPVAKDAWSDPPIVLLWVANGGLNKHGHYGIWAMGHCYRSHDGTIRGRASGFVGLWDVTHWMPMPAPVSGSTEVGK